jgi:hypothetical protein
MLENQYAEHWFFDILDLNSKIYRYNKNSTTILELLKRDSKYGLRFVILLILKFIS